MVGDDITAKFMALQNAIVSDFKVLKHQSEVLGEVLEEGALNELRGNAGFNQKIRWYFGQE